MTLLQVMAETDAADVRLRTTDAGVIGSELASRGIVFDRWPVTLAGLDAHPSPEQILADYADRVDELNRDGRYKYIDVAALHPLDDPGWPDAAQAARSKFLAEHRHAEDEVRFFAAGRGCFYLHLEPDVLAVVCESGDLLSVPAGTRHWFDMGVRPDFAAIRFFQEADGWIGDFTGDDIGGRFPTLDQLLVA
jgi:1,2-dihydroxy-3-keto-5-methylthiopentene dioxygenase